MEEKLVWVKNKEEKEHQLIWKNEFYKPEWIQNPCTAQSRGHKEAEQAQQDQTAQKSDNRKKNVSTKIIIKKIHQHLLVSSQVIKLLKKPSLFKTHY